MTEAKMNSIAVDGMIAYLTEHDNQICVDVMENDVTSTQLYLNKNEAVALAHWILDTFEKEEKK